MKNRFPTDEAAAYYLAAMIDGEGTVRHSKSYINKNGKRTCGTRLIGISNTDSNIIDATTEALDQLGIEYTCKRNVPRKSENHKPISLITIHSRVNLAKVFEMVPIQQKFKQDRLRSLLDSYRRMPSDQDINKLYFGQNLSSRRVADLLDCSYKYVLSRVDSRNRSEAASNRYKE